jgi:predicted cupin superfamily sugar epimerase
MRADQLIHDLELAPHPEGGWYRRLYRSELAVYRDGAPRAALTTILYLLRSGETSRWHRIDADEAWHHYEGAPLRLWRTASDFHSVEEFELGRPGGSTLPCHVIPAGTWQAARTLGEYSLVGCTVAPGFDFAGFSLLSDDPAAVALLHDRAPQCATLL